MAIGYPVTQDSINNQAGSLAIRLRNLAQDSANFNTATDGLSLTGVGFSSPDATAMTTAVNLLGSLASLYYGTTFIAGLVNYDSGLAVLRGLDIAG